MFQAHTSYQMNYIVLKNQEYKWGDTVKFSYSQIEPCCFELRDITQNMAKILKDIETINNNIFNYDTWEGPGASYYHEKIKSLTSNFEQVYIELKSATMFLAQTAMDYSKLDKQVVMQVTNNFNISESIMSMSKFFGGN